MIYSIILFLIGFAFDTLHESNAFRKTFSKFGSWFEFKNPIKMKEKFKYFSFLWNFYHFSGWIAQVFYFTAFFVAYADKMYSWFGSYVLVGIFVGFVSFIINLVLYGIHGSKK